MIISKSEMRKLIFLFLLVAGCSRLSFADQFICLSREKADSVKNYLATHQWVMIYCPCCGTTDNKPEKELIRIDSVKLKHSCGGFEEGGSFYSLLLYGSEKKQPAFHDYIDLAYTWMYDRQKKKWIRLAEIFHLDYDACGQTDINAPAPGK